MLAIALVSLFAGPVVSTETTCDGTPGAIEELLALPAVRDAKVALFVKNLSQNREIAAHNADLVLVPASNVKVVSTAAALYHLGPSFRFRTEILADVDESGVVKGNLYVRGDGDPYLLPERIWQLAGRLYYAGLRQVRGDIIVDDSAFAGPRLANGHEQDRSSAAYMAPTGAVSVGFNAVLVHVRPGLPGEPPRILVEPRSAYERIDNRATTIPRGRSRIDVDIFADGDRSRIQITGKISSKETAGRSFWRRIDNPPVFSGEVLKEALRRQDVVVRGNVRQGAVPAEQKSYLQISSPPLSELVMVVNKSSNNFMAEQLALGMARAVRGEPATWETAEALISDFLEQRVGLAKQSYTIKNASGLHDVNHFSPRQLVAVLETMRALPAFGPEYVTSMAVASSSGTLVSRMRESQAAGLLRAKTGTLSIASALSGYVTTQAGDTLAFAFVFNDYKSPISEITAAQDALGVALANTPLPCPGPATVSTIPAGRD